MLLANLLKNHTETYSGIALSTGHLSKDSLDWLNENYLKSNVMFKRDTGFIIKLYQDFILSYDDMPKELEHIITVVICAGFCLLEFDADAHFSELFTYYDQ